MLLKSYCSDQETPPKEIMIFGPLMICKEGGGLA